MTKLYPGPLVSDVHGSIGSVTYYRLFGKLIARARVRPHQKISSKRWWNRWSWQQLMLFWRVYFEPLWAMYRPYAAAHGMHPVNVWMRLNHRYTWPLTTFFVEDRVHSNLLTVTRIDHPSYDIMHVVWNPADFPAWYRLFSFAPISDPDHVRHWGATWSNDGDWINYTHKHEDSWWYFGVLERGGRNNYLLFKAPRADIPVE